MENRLVIAESHWEESSLYFFNTKCIGNICKTCLQDPEKYTVIITEAFFWSFLYQVSSLTLHLQYMAHGSDLSCNKLGKETYFNQYLLPESAPMFVQVTLAYGLFMMKSQPYSSKVFSYVLYQSSSICGTRTSISDRNLVQLLEWCRSAHPCPEHPFTVSNQLFINLSCSKGQRSPISPQSALIRNGLSDQCSVTKLPRAVKLHSWRVSFI